MHGRWVVFRAPGYMPDGEIFEIPIWRASLPFVIYSIRGVKEIDMWVGSRPWEGDLQIMWSTVGKVVVPSVSAPSARG